MSIPNKSASLHQLKQKHASALERCVNLLDREQPKRLRSPVYVGGNEIERQNGLALQSVNPISAKMKCGARRLLHRVYFPSFKPFFDPFESFLETWRTQLPDYEIIQWNESNVDVNANEWMARSYKAKDPVFLSEYVRWDALLKYGGVYLDSDCEVLNGSRFDELVNELFSSDEYDAFIGVEEYSNGHPTAQTIAAKPGADLVKFMHDLYGGPLSSALWHWRSERGLIGPQLMSLYFRECGLESSKGFFWRLDEPVIVGRVKIYPQDFFSPKFETCGKKLHITSNTSIYHLFANLNVDTVSAEAEKTRMRPLRLIDYSIAAGLNIPDEIIHSWRPAGRLSCISESKTYRQRHRSSGSLLPKSIHRIYFGFDGKSDPYDRYLSTWTKQMPDYEIKHWNATNLPISNCHYSRTLFEERDHAFLSDYFRWWVLKEHGGIYLDADVEVVNGPLMAQLMEELEQDDRIHAIIGIDSKKDGWYTAHSMVCKRGSPLAAFMCELYEDMGSLSIWRKKVFYFMAPQLTSLYFTSHGWNVEGMGSSPDLSEPIVVAGVKIYPQDWFSPMRPHMVDGIGDFVIDSFTANTALCHHFSCSWHKDDSPYRKSGSDGRRLALLDELIDARKAVL